jgi:hypothetical protein
MNSKSCIWLLCVIFIVGCSSGSNVDYSGLGLIKVTGVVTLDGSPLPDVTVLFESSDGQFSSGVTDENGQYRLAYDSDTDGVTPGEKIIRISNKPMSEEGDEFESEDEELSSTEQKETLPPKFNTKSDLKMTVPSSSYDIELHS